MSSLGGVVGNNLISPAFWWGLGNKPFLLRQRVCVLAGPFLADFKGVRKVQGPGIEGKRGGRGRWAVIHSFWKH